MTVLGFTMLVVLLPFPSWWLWRELRIRAHVRALGHEDRKVREAAVRGLKDLGALGPLVTALGYGDRPVREAVAYALKALPDRDAVGPLLRVLEDCRSPGRIEAAELLGVLQDERAVEPLIVAVVDADSEVRHIAAWALGRIQDQRAVEPLIAVLVDCRARGRIEAAEVLGVLVDKRAVEPLVVAISDADAGVREAAAVALGRIQDARAVGPLLEALRDSHSCVRTAAAAALGGLGGPGVAEGLREGVWDCHPEVRHAAALALAQLGEPQWLVWEKRDGRNFAALAAIGPLPAVAPLLLVLEAGDEGTRSTAALRLGFVGDACAIEPLRNALGEEPGVRKAAAVALARLGEPHWERCVQGDDRDFARLGASGDSRAVEPLLKALRREPARGWAAAAALAALRDARATEPLLGALGHLDAVVRKTAADALALLGDPRWQARVRGDDDDFARLVASGEHRVVATTTASLVSLIGGSSWDRRKAAARALVLLGQSSPGALKQSWGVVQRLVTAAHSDGRRHVDLKHRFRTESCN